MTPKPKTAECPACHQQARAFIINNNVFKVGGGCEDNPKRRCIDCWNHGREPAPEVGKTPHAGALDVEVTECHSAGFGLAGAPAPLHVQGSGA